MGAPVTLLYFGPLAELTGKTSEKISVDQILASIGNSTTGSTRPATPEGLNVAHLFRWLSKNYGGSVPELLLSCGVCVNMEYLDEEDTDGVDGFNKRSVIHAGDEVALIPPVSSG